MRTHFSDDLLWLAFATSHYLHATGDLKLLDETVPFIEGAAIPEGAEDAYYAPAVSAQQASRARCSPSPVLKSGRKSW